MKKMVYLDGGAGRVLCAVPAVETLSKQYEVEILTAYPGIFRNNPNIKKVHDLLPDANGKDGLSRCWPIIKDNDFVHPEPYHNHLFYQDKMHLIDCFANELNVSLDNTKPSLYLTDEEINKANMYYTELKEYYKYKKIICFQPFGSSGIGENDNTYRSLPTVTAEKIYKKLNENNIGVIYIGKEPANDIRLHTKKMTLRDILSLVYVSDGILAVDSLIQHVAYAFEKPGVVCWGSTSSKVLGYSTMTNIYKKGFVLKEPWQARFPMDNQTNKACMYYDDETIDAAVSGIEAI